MTIKYKILLPTLAAMLLLVVAVMISVSTVFTNYTHETVTDEIIAASKVANAHLDMLWNDAALASSMLAGDSIVSEAVTSGDRNALSARLAQLLNGVSVDFCTILDPNGTVMLRVHEPDNFGDSLASQQNIKSAMSGTPLTTVEEGTAVRLSVRSGNPIYDADGNVVGVVSTGYRLDQNGFVDKLKELTGSETTVFLKDERISTTVLDDKGARAIGTKSSAEVAATVLAGGTYEGQAVVMGNDAFVKYTPIRSADGTTIGMLFVGRYTSVVQAAMREFILVGVLATVIIALLTVTPMVIIIRRITKHVRDVAAAAVSISKGDLNYNLNIARKDEIGELAGAFGEMAAAITALISDIGRLTDAARAGKLSTRADASAHVGEYGEIISGVNEILDAVTAPVQTAAAALEEISRGDLSARVDGEYHGDHALIQTALNATADSLREYITQIETALGAMAQGDLTVSIDSVFSGDFVALKDAINQIAQSLNGVMGNINTAADDVSAGTLQVSSGAQHVAQGATQQASAIEQLTATISEIAEQTKKNARSVTEVTAQTTATMQYAREGNEKMKALQAAMEKINESSANISKIVREIDNIAFQTNILALNAAVEASHAGSYGQGFAVVAEEVRSLADKSAAAAKDTTALIEDSIRRAADGTRIANETAQALEKIVASVSKASDAMGEIAHASNGQATGIEQVNRGIEQMSQVVQTNSAVAEQSAALASELSDHASQLKRMVSMFNMRQTQPAIAATQRQALPSRTITR